LGVRFGLAGPKRLLFFVVLSGWRTLLDIFFWFSFWGDFGVVPVLSPQVVAAGVPLFLCFGTGTGPPIFLVHNSLPFPKICLYPGTGFFFSPGFNLKDFVFVSTHLLSFRLYLVCCAHFFFSLEERASVFCPVSPVL